MRSRLALLVAALLLLAACQPSASGDASGEPSASASASASGSASGSASETDEPSAPGSAAPSEAGGGGGGGGSTPTPPPPPPSSVNCSSGSLGANQFTQLRSSSPTARLGNGYCIVGWTLFFDGEAGGTATVRAGSATLLTMDMSFFNAIGQPGAGSGERHVTVSPAVGINPNTTVTLDLSACNGCSSLLVTMEAASR